MRRSFYAARRDEKLLAPKRLKPEFSAINRNLTSLLLICRGGFKQGLLCLEFPTLNTLKHEYRILGKISATGRYEFIALSAKGSECRANFTQQSEITR